MAATFFLPTKIPRRSGVVNLHQMSSPELQRFRALRWQARTDLVFLANKILGYPDISRKIHVFIEVLQKFPTPTGSQFIQNDNILSYRPILPVYALPGALKGSRKVLILDPRGFLKSSCNVMTHSIQWLLNYPDMSMLITQATSPNAEAILDEITRHFVYNEKFRALFPEHAPKSKKQLLSFTKTALTTPARSPQALSAEVSILTGSIEKGLTGHHFDVLKFSDIVYPENSKTIGQIRSVIDTFAMMRNLTVRPDSWIDVEGTIYHHSDLYTRIMDAEMERPPQEREWKIHVRPCFVKDTGDKPQRFTPDEVRLPDKRDAEGKRISWWPERFPTEKLEAIERDPIFGGKTFATQQLLNPKLAMGAPVFPVDENYPKKITREAFSRVPKSHYDVAVDTAETQGDRSNYTSMAVGCWDTYNRCYVVEVVHGKLTASQIISELFRLNLKYKPRTIKIEKTAFVRGLEHSIRREMDLTGIYLPYELIPRDTQVSKIERITNTLQPPYKSGELRFLDDLKPWKHMVKELENFPDYEFDDILDSLSDLFQNKDWMGRQSVKGIYTSKAEKEALVAQIMRKELDLHLGIQNDLEDLTEKWDSTWTE